MKRRQFLRNGALAGAFALASCQTRSTADSKSLDLASLHRSFELDELSIGNLLEGMNNGKYTSRGLVEKYLERIRDIDNGGIKLNSVIALNPDALALADASDETRRRGELLGPLHGIPFLVKDNINTGDKMMTTAGSLAMDNHYAKADASIVSQLRAAGAVLLGKTNLSEWANFRSTRSSSGWSSKGGQTRNPYDLNRNPCGSSSGSAVAVAASLCAFAIGTETNGSIICPASVNGIVGLKPTVGLVSRTGIIPISHTQDTAGPMTRTVTEAAIVLGAITRADNLDKSMLNRAASLPADYTVYLQSNALQGKRIGVEKTFIKVHEKVDLLLSEAIAQLTRLGATVVEVDHKDRLRDIKDNEFKLLQYEFKDGLNRYLASADAPVRSLRDVIAYNKANVDKIMPYFGQEILEASQARGDLGETEYKEALEKVVTIARKSIDGLLEEFQLDAICGPATGPAWCTDLVNGDAFSGYGMGSGAAMAGYPSISVPMGNAHGLPVGLLFMGAAFSEPQLLAIAYAYEQISKNRKSPAYRNGL